MSLRASKRSKGDKIWVVVEDLAGPATTWPTTRSVDRNREVRRWGRKARDPEPKARIEVGRFLRQADGQGPDGSI